MIRRLAIIGVGLIGGSFALALKKNVAVGEVVGLGRSRGNLAAALERRVIDRVADDAASAVREADLVFLSVPVGQMSATLGQIAPHLSAQAIVTDAGSTKQGIIETARSALGSSFPRFIPGHPIAGAELSGAAAARDDLYRNRKVVMTPVQQTDRKALEEVRMLWQTCGAEVLEMTPADHDAIFAAVSHLPHVLAFALVDMLRARPNADTLFDFAGGGFRDFTRIAASSPEMWRDILEANRDALMGEIKSYSEMLSLLARALENKDWPQLEAVFRRASERRNAWTADTRPRSDE
jgi:prephenate dehydrogenase